MASKRRELTSDDDPWRVSAFISALMELLLSVLLFLGAAIAFITSQLVKYFGLDPPCTYIGCSHPRSSKRRRRYSVRRHHHHPKAEHLSERFLDRRKSWAYPKLQLQSEEFLSSYDDADGSHLSEKNDSSSRQSTAVSSNQQSLLDEDRNVSYNHQNVNRVRSASSSPVYKKSSLPKYVKSKASVFYGDGKQSTKEERIPLFFTKSVSACSSDFDVDEDRATSSLCSEKPRSQKKRDPLTDGDASVFRDNKHECHYMLLEDEEPSWRKYVKPNAAVFGGDGIHSAGEELAPLYSTRSVSARGSDLDAKDDCQMSSASSDALKKPSSRKEKLQRGTLIDADASISSETEHKLPYMLLEDEEPSWLKCVKPNAATLVGDVTQSTKEECVPLFIRRSNSAHGSDSDAEDDCELSSTSTGETTNSSSQKEKLGGTLVEGIAPISAKQECVPLVFRRSISANGSDSDAEDDCEMPSTSADVFKKPSSQKEPEGGTLVEGNASISSDTEHEHHYMLLKDEEVFASMSSDTEQEHHYMQLKDEDEDEEGFEAPFFNSIECLCRDSEYERHAMLLEGEDDAEKAKAPLFSDLQAESGQPLLECISDGGLEAPKSLTTPDVGSKVANAVVVPDSEVPSEIEQAAENCAQCECIKDNMDTTCASACTFSSGPGEGKNTGPLFIPLEVPAVIESKVEDEGFDIWNKGQINLGFSADETNKEFIQGFENVNGGNSEGNMVEDQVGEDGMLKEEVLKEPHEGLLNVHVLEKEDIDTKSSLLLMELESMVPKDLLEFDKVQEIKAFESGSESVLEDPLLQVQEHVEDVECVPVKPCTAGSDAHGEDSSKVSIESDLQGIHEYALLNRGKSVHETEGKSDEETLVKSSLGVVIQDAMDQYFISFKGHRPEDRVAKCVSLFDNIDVQQGSVGQVAVAKGNSLEDAASQTDEQSSKSEQKELVLKDSEQDKEETPLEEDQEEGLDTLREALCAERKILAALEMELENERNAAAIATSEAMAMISRLQEEKSAMQMEVVQLQRMSEEKAEYDEEAMELLKEILLKREKEKHALEKELELYRERLRAEKLNTLKKSSAEKPNKDVVMPASTPMLLLRGTNEDHDSVSPEGKNDRLEALPSLQAFYDASFPYITSMGQNMSCREHFGLNPQPVELKDTKGSRVDQVGACLQEDKENHTEPFTKGLNGLHDIPQELRGTSRSIFSTNDEETQFILERLWVLEEELRELRGEDGLGVSLEAQHVGGSPVKRKSDGSCADSCGVRCVDGEIGEHKEEEGAGMLLPIHDVYEVQSTPNQGIQQSDPLEYSENMLRDFESFPRDISQEYMAASRHSQRPLARALFPSKEAHCDSALALTQDYPCADDSHKQCLKATDGKLVTTDVIQQLAVRLQVLETDRGLLREILESFRHRDAERKLLQEIAQYLRQLPMADSRGASAVVLKGPFLPTFSESCGSALKKRRYCSGPGQTPTLLLQQKSI